ARSDSAPAAGSARTSVPAGTTSATEPAPAPAVAPAKPSAPTGESGSDDGVDVLRRRWPEVLETLGRLRRVTWTLVSQDAQVAELEGGVLRLAFSTPPLATTFRSGPHAELVQQAVHETLGLQVRVEPAVGDPRPVVPA